MFALCKDFDKLSLEDNTDSSSSQRHVQPLPYGAFHHFIWSWTHCLWSQSIIKQIRAPFIECPYHILDSSFQLYDIVWGLVFLLSFGSVKVPNSRIEDT